MGCEHGTVECQGCIRAERDALRARVAELEAEVERRLADPPAVVPRAEAAAIVRDTELAPDTHTGARQRWVLENAARRIEGRDPAPWQKPPLALGDRLVPRAELEAAQRERDEAHEILSSLSSWMSQGGGDERTTAAEFDRRIREGFERHVRVAEARLQERTRERDEARAAAAAMRAALEDLSAAGYRLHMAATRAVSAEQDNFKAQWHSALHDAVVAWEAEQPGKMHPTLASPTGRGWLPPDLAAECEAALERMQATTQGEWYANGTDDAAGLRAERDRVGRMLRKICDERDALLARLRARGGR